MTLLQNNKKEEMTLITKGLPIAEKGGELLKKTIL